MFKRFFGNYDPRMNGFFVILALFSVVAAFFDYRLALVQLGLILILYIYYFSSNTRRLRMLNKYIEAIVSNLDSMTSNSLTDFPLPMLVVRSDGEILWYNDAFKGLSVSAFGKYITGTIPRPQLERLAAGDKDLQGMEIELDGRHFKVYCNANKGDFMDASGALLILYLVEDTDYIQLLKESAGSKPVVGIAIIDSYDELSQGARESERAGVLAKVDTILAAWMDAAHGVLRMTERGRYLFVCESRYLEAFIASKFDVLDRIREETEGSKLAVTLSIGIGEGGGSLFENHEFAKQAIDMALGRGGDQAVIKTKHNFEFFGGKSKAVEKRTKVKSRVMASALSELIDNATNVLIMGHKFADFDSVGASIGVARIVKIRQKPVNIIVNRKTCLATSILDKFEKVPEYDGVFVDRLEGLDLVSTGTLLVIVDTHSHEYIESPEIYQNCNKVAVIDHHRKMAQYIDNAILTYHEPYASSACEMIGELAQYIDGKNTILKEEAEAMLAGIVLDTKNFYFKTGFRTFEAAAYLKKSGADPIEVKKLFQSNYESYIRRTELISAAEFYKDRIAISIWDGGALEDSKVIMAQAADELLNIEGVDASFVLYPYNASSVHISARSLGTVNVQLIAEKLGGGGHHTTAGVQLNVPAEEARKMLTDAIEDYFKDVEQGRV